jgi:hypothetical protein
MGRELQLGYGSNRRVYGDPGEGYSQPTPREEYFGGRKVSAVNPDIPFEEPKAAACLATTKAGDPCKARPAEGKSFCSFHKE